jgi:hypothetical protein
MTLRAIGTPEAKVAAGDRSPLTIAALARAFGNTGYATGAACLLESLIIERPHDRSVLNTFADFQHAAGCNERLIHTLETLQDMTPRINRRRKLAKLYAVFDRRTEQLDALRGLVGQRVAELDEYSSLARLEASMGRSLAGAAVLRCLDARCPKAVDVSVVALEPRVLLVGGALGWLRRGPLRQDRAAVLRGSRLCAEPIQSPAAWQLCGKYRPRAGHHHAARRRPDVVLPT